MTSIDSGLGARRPGDHLCFPYDNEDEKTLTLVTFVREGLARHERCLFTGTPAEQVSLLAALEAAGVPAQRALADGALVLATPAETYFRTGAFDPDDSLAVMDGLIDLALADGFAGLRATGGASGPIPDELWKQLLVYEARLNQRVARRPFVGLCWFHGAHVSGERVQDVLRTHPLAVLRGEVCENPFYEQTDLALSGDSRARVDWQLHQLRAYNRARKRLVATAESRHLALSTLADELADPLFALEREVHALGDAPDQTPVPERLEAAAHQLRLLTAAVDKVRAAAGLVTPKPEVPVTGSPETPGAPSDPARRRR